MISINYLGRLGNNMIQYFAGRILAEKNKLYLNSEPKHLEDWGSFFKIQQTDRSYEKGQKTVIVNDNNFIELLSSKNQLTRYHYILDGYFQTSALLHTYQKYIRNTLKIEYQTIDPSQVFVVYRIGDLDGLRQMLPVEYYDEALSTLNFNEGYITSDTIDHKFVQYLSKKYSLKIISFNSPLATIDFAKNFNNLILSEGTFSWWIGFLSRAQTVIYNKRNYQWFGRDIFDFSTWQPLYWDYDNNKKPIRISNNI